MAARTNEEIVDRIANYRDRSPDDMLGFGLDVLVMALPFDAAKPLLANDVAEEDWNQEVDTEKSAVDYLRFALEKAENHRGISADRSVRKIREYAWLMGRDDAVTAMDDAPYENYGVPMLRAFATTVGGAAYAVWHERAGTMLANMAGGLPCEPGCTEGCGR